MCRKLTGLHEKKRDLGGLWPPDPHPSHRPVTTVGSALWHPGAGCQKPGTVLYISTSALPAAPITVTSGHQAKNAFPIPPPQGSRTDGGGKLMGKVEVRNQTLRLAW